MNFNYNSMSLQLIVNFQQHFLLVYFECLQQLLFVLSICTLKLNNSEFVNSLNVGLKISSGTLMNM